ncbi:sensor histidine kinase [Streptomyces sp. PLK6-54]|uniref:histidine kinase n=1 Tax=Actinacidiphila acidipaludis TaxID=2873382 RepID=A0ABS7Q328_9ACTN|nr:sensor histidine kinase [Streptomyces acidipaludis]
MRAVLAWAGVAVYPAVLFQASPGGRDGNSLLWIVAGALLTVLVVALMRRRPWPAFTVLVGAWLTIIALAPVRAAATGGLQVLVTDLAVVLMAVERTRRSSLTAAAVAVVTQLACSVLYAHGNVIVPVAGSIVLAAVVAWMAGNSVRERREHAAVLAVRATEQAVTAERLRIARELHDMVAHSIGVIAIQAGTGSRVIESQPDEARNALSAIEATSRETLSGLRRMLGALRQAEPDAAARPAPLDPTPGLTDLPRLVATTGEAGVRVEVHRRGQPCFLPAELDLSAFRIIQEALTNVVRHSGTAQCEVTLDYREAELTIEIVDDGRGCELPAAGGYGIIGMRERTALLQGEFSAGPRPEGGFRVQARLPLPGEAS